jgi:hypothetical protein
MAANQLAGTVILKFSPVHEEIPKYIKIAIHFQAINNLFL